MEHRRRGRVIDLLEIRLAVGADEHGQAHGAEAEGRGLEVELAERAVLHGGILPSTAGRREPPHPGRREPPAAGVPRPPARYTLPRA